MLPEHAAILLADDSEDDLFLMKEAFKEAGIVNPVHEVEDGEQVIAYLQGSGRFADRAAHPEPALCILDIKMPRKTGIEALKWIRASERWRRTPVLLLTASAHPADIRDAYDSCANAFHVKPTTAEELADLARAIKAYWLRFGEFPG